MNSKTANNKSHLYKLSQGRGTNLSMNLNDLALYNKNDVTPIIKLKNVKKCKIVLKPKRKNMFFI